MFKWLTDNIGLITVIAIMLSPIVTLTIQKKIEIFREKQQRKLNIFRTLMTTRGMPVSFDHVKALNMIDIEFYGKTKITHAWKSYLDCLCACPVTDDKVELKIWNDRRDDLFVEMLSEMAELLDYSFDKVHLKKAVYTPRAHGQEEDYQYFIRDNIKKLFAGEKAIPIHVVSTLNPVVSEKQQNV